MIVPYFHVSLKINLSERNASTLEGLMSAVTNIQTSVMKMWKTVDDLDEKVTSLSTTSAPSHQCQCDVFKQEILQAVNASNVSLKKEVSQKSGRLSSDLASLANDVKDIIDWKDTMTPVLTEILNKARISVYSQTKLGEDLDSQVSNIHLQLQSQPQVLEKSETLTKFQEVKDLIKQGTSGCANHRASAAPVPQSKRQSDPPENCHLNVKKKCQKC